MKPIKVPFNVGDMSKDKALKVIESCPFFEYNFDVINDFNALSRCSDDFIIRFADILIDYGLLLVAVYDEDI